MNTGLPQFLGESHPFFMIYVFLLILFPLLNQFSSLICLLYLPPLFLSLALTVSLHLFLSFSLSSPCLSLPHANGLPVCICFKSYLLFLCLFKCGQLPSSLPCLAQRQPLYDPAISSTLCILSPRSSLFLFASLFTPFALTPLTNLQRVICFVSCLSSVLLLFSLPCFALFRSRFSISPSFAHVFFEFLLIPPFLWYSLGHESHAFHDANYLHYLSCLSSGHHPTNAIIPWRYYQLDSATIAFLCSMASSVPISHYHPG